MSVKIHPTAIIDDGVTLGAGTQVWHWTHICENAVLGKNCTLGQNVYVGPGVQIGNGVKIQNNVSIYSGVFLEDDVFCGPSVVFTNVKNPRSEINQKHNFLKTMVKRGATVGANATIVCGVELGSYCFIGAGSLVSKNVAPHSLVFGVPARHVQWVDKHGQSTVHNPTDV